MCNDSSWVENNILKYFYFNKSPYKIPSLKTTAEARSRSETEGQCKTEWRELGG